MSYHLELVTLEFEGRSLQLRPEQLTVTNVAKTFRLIEETIILVSERGTVAIPEDGVFVDVDSLDRWTVQGDKKTGPRVTGQPTTQSSSKWRPQIFPPPVRATSNPGPSRQTTSSWNKSIEICCIRNGSGEVVAKSEHPITLDESSANVPCIQEKLSQEAFGGARIRLLNSKNILIADADGTRGSKFWRGSKIIRAITEAEFCKRERLRGGDAGLGSSGVQASVQGTRNSPLTVVSDSDSDSPIVPLIRRRKRPYVPPAPELSDSDSSQPRNKMICTDLKVAKMFMEIKEDVQTIKSKLSESENKFLVMIRDIFTCLICKEVMTETSGTLMLPCCRNALCCRECLSRWLADSSVCPHCREEVRIENCLPQPLIRPIIDILRE